jgi:hypothetical protein
MILADSSKLVVYFAIVYAWEYTSIDELKSVPLSRTLCLKVPPKPPLCFGLKRGDLGLDVAPSVVFIGR